MRVNISYSIDVEEIPVEVDKLLGELEHALRRVLGELEHTVGKNPLEIIENIDDIREVLVATDQRLADCSGILSGYIGLKAGPSVPHPAPQPEQDDDPL